ncbi:hypothetical protein GTY84_22150 [Streptomyces sp. SID8352]|nr:hypothetical protein [Streptomyces sp. SID8352]
MPADEVTSGTDAEGVRARTGPRHAAPRKPLLTRFHMPAGKAIALAAMPTAVLMGMGFTPTLALADGNDAVAPSSNSLTAEEYRACVEALAGGPGPSGSAEPPHSAGPSEPAAGPSGTPTPSSSPDPTPDPTPTSAVTSSPTDDGGQGVGGRPSPSASAGRGTGPSPSPDSGSDDEGGPGTAPGTGTVPPAPQPSVPRGGGLLQDVGDALGDGLGDTLGGVLPGGVLPGGGGGGGVGPGPGRGGGGGTGGGPGAGAGRPPVPDAAPTAGAPRPEASGPAADTSPAADATATGVAGKTAKDTPDTGTGGAAGDTGGEGTPPGPGTTPGPGTADGATAGTGPAGGEKDGAGDGPPGATEAATPAPTPSASTGPDPADCPVATDAEGGVDNPVPLPDDPWYLNAGSLLLKGASYQGVVRVRTANGTTKKVLKYVISGGTDIGDLHQTYKDAQSGRTYHVRAARGSTSTIRDGETVMYTESISGNLLGLVPVTFAPDTPPPLDIPLIYFTKVTVVQAGQFGGTLHIPGLRQYITG